MRRHSLVFLEYAGPQPGHRRRYILLSALILFCCVLWRWWPALSGQAVFLYWQHRAINWAIAPHTVVFETDQDRAAKLLAAGPPYLPYSAKPRPGYVPPTHAVYCPPEFLKIGVEISEGATQPSSILGIVFLHLRSSPAGHERLVVVELAGQQDDSSNRDYALYPAAYLTASWKPGTRLGETQGYSVPQTVSIFVSRLYAGQIDSTDASHFIIEYDTWFNLEPDLHGVIDGWLRDDDTVDLQLRDGPAKGRW